MTYSGHASKLVWFRHNLQARRNLVRRLLSYAIENPIAKIAKPKTPDAPIEVFTPEQVRALLDAAEPSMLPFLAIGAFAGLRHAEICRLDWSEIKLDRNFIEVTALKSKTASRGLVTIQPNLKVWLIPLAKEKGRVEPPNSRKLRGSGATSRRNRQMAY